MSVQFRGSEEHQEEGHYEYDRAFRASNFTITGEDVDRVIDKMNEAVAMDKNSIARLCDKLHWCSEELKDESIFFCHGITAEQPVCAITALGFLNGILKELGVPRIAVMREDGKFLKFTLYTGE